MIDISSRALFLLQRAKDYNIQDITAYISKEQYISATSYEESLHYYCSILGRTTPENAQVYKSSLSEQETKEIHLNIDISSSALVPIDINVFSVTEVSPVELKFDEADDKIYLLCFWVTWCGASQVLISSLNKMLDDNTHWKGIVEIICITLDETVEYARKIAEESRWNEVKPVWVGSEGLYSTQARTYNISDVPICLFVKNKRVIWKGNPCNRDLEEDINGLLEGRPFKLIRKNQLLNTDELAMKIESIKKLLREAHESDPEVNPPKVYLCTQKVTDGDNSEESLISLFYGAVRDKYAYIHNQIFEKVNEFLPGTEKRIKIIETIPPVTRAEVCSICSKALSPAENQYICIFCDPKHAHCEECENLTREGKGSVKLAHPHYVMKIHPEADKLDGIRKIFDRPNQILEDDPENVIHTCLCDNRTEDGLCPNIGEVNGTRFKCLHCSDFDYCNHCAKLWYENPSEDMLKTARERGHSRYHVMVKIAFPINEE